MSLIRPFRALRPARDVAAAVSSKRRFWRERGQVVVMSAIMLPKLTMTVETIAMASRSGTSSSRGSEYAQRRKLSFGPITISPDRLS